MSKNNQGEQWMVIGLAPDVRFVASYGTREEAVAAIEDGDADSSGDYAAVVKASDFFSLD